MAAAEAQYRSLRRLGMFCFISWAVFVAVAMRLFFTGPEGPLRLVVAVIGAAVALFAVARAGAWPRVLYMLSIGYLAYFAAGSSWYALWEVAAVPAEGTAETLAVTLELAARVVAGDFAAARYVPALAQAYDLAIMPAAQLIVMIYLARALLRRP